MISLSPVWTLTGADGAPVEAATLGVSAMTRRRVSQAADTCAIRVDGRALDAVPLFATGSAVTVRQNGAVWFVGRVTSVPATGTARAESQTYELSGPWWYLEKLVCRQVWNFQGGAESLLVSRLILGQDVYGGAQTTGGIIAETLQYAIDCGAPFQIGTIDPSLEPPLDEVKDLTCAEVIRKVLRWHPDCVCWFDYATSGGPTFHCRARAHLPAATLTLGQAPLSAVRGVAARPDLLVPAVVIHYELAGQTNGVMLTDLVTDAAPPTATGREFGAVVLTLPLRGASVTTVEQRVVTRPVIDYIADPRLRDSLIARHAGLARLAENPQVGRDGITITSIRRVVTDGSTESDPDHPGGTRPASADTTLGNELLEGSVTDWMRDDGVRTARQRLRFQYTADYGDGSDPSKICGPFSASCELTATNAGGSSEGSTTFQHVSSASSGDTVPLGLAAAYFASLSGLQYSGRAELVEAEPGGAVGMGCVLNLAGAAEPTWAAMRALVIEEETEAATGTTAITFGPAGHLSPGDLATLLGVTRPGVGGRVGETASAATNASGSRASGQSGGGQGTVRLGVTTPGSGAVTSAPLPALRWNVVVNGQPTVAFFQFLAAGWHDGRRGEGSVKAEGRRQKAEGQKVPATPMTDEG